jgi:hypothetical protein
VLALVQRYPRLVEGLHASVQEQQQRLVAQLLICQLPRVEDRVQAILWLLAETWGRVTPSGTVLPMRLTHDAIGQLIGARRSTVTLGLRALADRGVILRRRDDWLLLERGNPTTGLGPLSALPHLTAPAVGSPWVQPVGPAAGESVGEAMERLRQRREATFEASRAGVATAREISRQSRMLLQRVRQARSGGGRVHEQDDAGDRSVAAGPDR